MSETPTRPPAGAGAPTPAADLGDAPGPGTDTGAGTAAAPAGGGGVVVGFLPWILYWVLVGNAPFLTAVLAALALSVVVNVVAVVRHRPLMVLEVGTTAVFAVLAVLAATLPTEALERWIQPLGNLGLFLIVVVSILIGKPFTLQYTRQSAPPEMWDQPGFRYVCTLLSWVWAGTLGAMTVLAAIPPIVDGEATIRDETDVLSIACYWVLPFALLGLTMLFTATYPDWFAEAAGGDAAPDDASASAPPPAPPLPLDGTGDRRRDGTAALEVTPTDVLADEPVAVRVTGAAPGAEVRVGAETVDGFGHRWRSDATFRADADGAVDLATAAPEQGTWGQADPWGLVWSMAFASEGEAADIFIPPWDPAATQVSATVGERQVQATLVRRAGAAGVAVHEVREPALVGRLFLPEGDRPLPGVVLFPGSEGGLDSQSSNAALLAAHGCAALVAAYFSGDGPPLDGLPATLARVPLERFADAVRWLAAHPRVDAGRVSAMSISRGAEGLLATAARVGDLPLRRIVAVAPSSATWVGLGDAGSLAGIPAWTLGGVDLPAVQTDDRQVLAEIAGAALRRRGHGHGPALLHLVRSYAGRIDDPLARGEAAIAAERIAAPLLLVAGTDDQVWPSEAMARRLLDRRPGVAGDELLVYEGAGHLIRLGCWPATVSATGGIALGGTAAGYGHAQADVTPRIVAAVTGGA